MRIAFYTDYPPCEEKGGAEIRIDRLSRMLAERGHEVHIFCGGNRRGEEAIGGVHYHIYENFWRGLPIGARNVVYVLQTLWRFLFLHIDGFDVVDAYRPLRGCTVQSFAGSHISGFRHSRPLRKLVLIPLIAVEFFSARSARGIIAVSEAVKRDLVQAYGVDPDAVSVTHAGTGEEFLNVNVSRKTNPIRVIATGSAVKGVATVRLVGKMLPDIEFAVISGMPHSEIPGQLADANIFLHPSRADGLSMSVREAMAVGLPVIASRVGGNPELITDGENGYLVDVGDFRAIVEKIKFLSENPQVREMMGRISKDRIRREFTWKRTLNLTLLAYRKLPAEPLEDRNAWVARWCTDKFVLDVGCVGGGEFDDDRSEWLHGHIERNARTVVGIDSDELGARRLWNFGFNVFCGDAEDFNLNQTFDVVVAGELIEHLSNPGMFLDCARRHLKENGRLVLTTPNGRHPRISLAGFSAPNHVQLYNVKELSELLRRHGFEVESVQYFNHKERILPFKIWEKLIVPLYPQFARQFGVVARGVE